MIAFKPGELLRPNFLEEQNIFVYKFGLSQCFERRAQEDEQFIFIETFDRSPWSLLIKVLSYSGICYVQPHAMVRTT